MQKRAKTDGFFAPGANTPSGAHVSQAAVNGANQRMARSGGLSGTGQSVLRGSGMSQVSYDRSNEQAQGLEAQASAHASSNEHGSYSSLSIDSVANVNRMSNELPAEVLGGPSLDSHGMDSKAPGGYSSSKAEPSLTQHFAVALGSTLIRQFRFPSFIRGAVEALLFCSVFLAAGIISLGTDLSGMLSAMVPFVLMMMFCMVASGVYRTDITNSILNLYIHSLYGFLLAGVGVISMSFFMPVEYSQPKFLFFFLFFAFFVLNTLRPIISGTDFMDGGGRRGN